MKMTQGIYLGLWALACIILITVNATIAKEAPEGGAMGFLVWVCVGGLCYSAFKTFSQNKEEKAINDAGVPLSDRRSNVISQMISKGYAIDNEGEGYIQFKKPKGSVIGSIIFFFVALFFLFALPLVGGLLLVIWIVSLFFVNRPVIKTVTFK